jgi:hypothetical protein
MGLGGCDPIMGNYSPSWGIIPHHGEFFVLFDHPTGNFTLITNFETDIL